MRERGDAHRVPRLRVRHERRADWDGHPVEWRMLSARMRVLETTLERVAQDSAEHQMAAPANIVFGDVVRLRDSMDWFGALSGKELKVP